MKQTSVKPKVSSINRSIKQSMNQIKTVKKVQDVIDWDGLKNSKQGTDAAMLKYNSETFFLWICLFIWFL